MMFVLGILIFAVGIAFSIAWHELGHFVTARWFGIKVTEFMVGFGKTIWSRKSGETEVGLKLVPLGGYVRMIGMIPPAKGELYGRTRRTGPFQGLIDDVRAQSAMDVRPEDAHRQFYLRAPWKRIVVMAAGPIMNLILAVVLFGISLMGVGALTSSTTVGAVSACAVPASSPVRECTDDAQPTPAAASDIRAGDRIVTFDGVPLTETDGQRLRELIRQSTGTVVVTVERGGQRVDLPTTLITSELDSFDRVGEYVQGSFLGVELVSAGYVRQDIGSVGDEIVRVVARTGQAIAELPSRVPGLFGSVFLGEERDINGPIGVVGVSRIGGEILAREIPLAAEASALLNLLAAVNISLFLFNLLPIPPLDGGQIFPAIWESIRRRIAKARGRRDPGPVDVAKLMPVAYVMALVFIVWTGLLLMADIINPVSILQ